MKTQRKQTNARPLLNNAFLNIQFNLYYIIQLSNMANKKKLNAASTQANKLIAELPEKRKKIKTQV